MGDTTLQNPEPDAPLVVPPPVAARPKAAFTDADGASRWVKTLPMLQVGQAHEALTGQLALLGEAQMPARERAKIAEIFREPVVRDDERQQGRQENMCLFHNYGYI